MSDGDYQPYRSGYQPGFKKQSGVLERNPATRMRLKRELADGSKTQRDLAGEYNVSQPAICKFAERHAEEIEDLRRNADDEFAGILFAKKVRRLEAYSDDAQDDEIPYVDRHRALRSIADELGEIPNRVHVQSDNRVEIIYKMTNANDEDMQ